MQYTSFNNLWQKVIAVTSSIYFSKYQNYHSTSKFNKQRFFVCKYAYTTKSMESSIFWPPRQLLYIDSAERYLWKVNAVCALIRSVLFNVVNLILTRLPNLSVIWFHNGFKIKLLIKRNLSLLYPSLVRLGTCLLYTSRCV